MLELEEVRAGWEEAESWGQQKAKKGCVEVETQRQGEVPAGL